MYEGTAADETSKIDEELIVICKNIFGTNSDKSSFEIIIFLLFKDFYNI